VVYGIVPQPASVLYFLSFGYLFWLGLGVGVLRGHDIHHLTGGRVGAIRPGRFLDAGMGTLPVMWRCFHPIFFGLSDLFPGARPDERAGNE